MQLLRPAGFAAALLAQALYYGLVWRRRRFGENADMNVKQPSEDSPGARSPPG